MNLQTLISQIKKVEFFIISTVVFIVLLLIFLTNQDTLKVESISFEKSTTNQELVIGENRIIIEFSRPLSSQVQKELVTFEPEFNDFEVKSSNNNLIISINSPLNKNSIYTLNLDKNVKDIYGQSISENLVYEFRTQRKEILFMRENTIFLQDITTKVAQKIYSSGFIEEYKSTNDGKYIYILELENFTKTTLKRYNRETEEINTLEISNNHNVRSFEIDQNNNLWLVATNRESSETEFYVLDQNFVEKNNRLETEIKTISTLKEIAENLYDFSITTEGELIFKTFSNIILTTPDAEVLKSYNNHEEVGVYNQNNNKYYNYINFYFPNNSTGELYELNYEERSKIDEFGEAIKQIDYFDNENIAIMTQRNLSNNFEYIYQIIIYDPITKERLHVFRSDEVSYENPNSDNSGNSLAIEEIRIDTLQSDYTSRSIGNSGRPEKADIVILENIDGEISETQRILDAYGMVWIN